MKIRKTATQKNFVIDECFYTEIDLDLMAMNNEIFKIDAMDTQYRIYASDLTEVKVICNEAGFYQNVAVGKNGKVYCILI